MVSRAGRETDAPALDLRGVECPMNFVRVKLALEKLRAGAALRITLDDGEPLRNVTRGLEMEGHEIVERTDNDDGTFRLLVRNKGR